MRTSKRAVVFFLCIASLSMLSMDTTMAYPPSGVITVEPSLEGAIVYTNSVKLLYSISVEEHWIETAWVTIFLDNNIYKKAELEHYSGWKVGGEVTLRLTQGEHTLKIVATAKGGHVVCPNSVVFDINTTTCKFIVDIGRTLNTSVIMMQEYNTSNANFKICTNMPDARASYSINEKEKVTLSKNELIQNQDSYFYNVNLPDLEYGMHNLTVYVTDIFGNTEVSNKSFFINTTETSTPIQPKQTFPSIILGATIITIVIAVTIVLLFNHKQRKQTTQEPRNNLSK